MTGSTIVWNITRSFSVASPKRVLLFAKVGEHHFENSDSGGPANTCCRRRPLESWAAAR
jgi:hypothetical protein